MRKFLMSSAVLLLALSPAAHAQDTGTDVLCGSGLSKIVPFGGIACEVLKSGEIDTEAMANALAPGGHPLSGLGEGLGPNPDDNARITPRYDAPGNQHARGNPCIAAPASLDCELFQITAELEAEYGTLE